MSGRLELHYSPDLSHLVENFLKKNKKILNSEGKLLYLTPDFWRVPTLKRNWFLKLTDRHALDLPFKSMPSFITSLFERMNIPLQRASYFDQGLILREIILQQKIDLQYFYSAEHPPGYTVIRELVNFFSSIRLDEAENKILKAIKNRLALSTSDKLQHDLILIFSKYLDFLKGRYLDEAALIKYLIHHLNRDFLDKYFPNLKTIVFEDISYFKKLHLQLFESFKDLDIDLYYLMPYGRNREIFAKKDYLFNKVRQSADHVKGYLDIRKLSDSLFQIKAPHFSFAEKLQIIPAGSRLDEVKNIAVRIKAEVKEGCCMCSEIAVSSPQLDVYVPLLEIIFDRYGIPHSKGIDTPLIQALPIQNLFLLLQTVQEDYPLSLLQRVMYSHFLKYKQTISSSDIPGMLSSFRVKKGRKELLRYVKKEKISDDSRRGGSRKKGPYQEILSAFQHIFDDLKFFEKSHSVDAWFEKILSIIEVHRFPQKIMAEAKICGVPLSQAHLGALDQLVDSLNHWKEIYSHIRGDTNVTLQEFIDIFTYINQATSFRIRFPARSGVQIVPLTELMKENFKEIFIIGMEESTLPGRTNISFTPPQHLPAHLLTYIDQDTYLRERELFLQILQYPASQLYFSYPKYHQDKPVLPSLFLRELERLSDAQLERIEKLQLYSPADIIEAIIPLQAKRDSVKLDLNKLPLAGQEIISEESIREISYKLNVIRDRQSGKSSSIWEGNLSENNVVVDYLNNRFSSAHFSPTQLEVYAHCPMIFFFERILAIEKEEIREAYLSPLDRGILIHEILFRFYSELTPEQRNLDGLLEIAREELSKISVSPGLLWELDKEHFLGNEDMKGILPAFLTYDEEISSRYTTRPQHFELSFGRPLISAEVHDPLSTENPFIYQDKKEKFYFSGKIDRVEIAPDGSLLIVDYKTGGLPTLREMWDGKRLQLPLYLLAVHNHLKAKYPKLKMAGGAFYALGRENEIEKKVVFMDDKRKIFNQDLFKSARFPNDKFRINNSPASLKEFLELVIDNAVGYIRKIRGGNYTHTPEESNCRSRNGKLCEYLPVCKVNWMKQATLENQSSTDKA